MNKEFPFCPVQTTLMLISDRWKVLILRDLLEGTKRFGELKKSIVITSALMSCFLLTACGSQSSSSKESSSTAAQSSTAKSSSKTSSHSDSHIQKACSSSDSSTTASSTAKTAKVDDKTTGVMLALLVEPDWFNYA